MPGRARLAIAAAALSLAGCDSPDGGAAPRIDERIDPALLAALDDPILVDPTLSQYSNRTTVRAPETPSGAAYPVGAGADVTDCGGALQHDPVWAKRLPAAMPVIDGARLLDAAGRQEPGCRIVVVRFAVPQAPARVVDWYWTRAARQGLSATQIGRGADQLVHGGGAGGSYVVIASPVASGSEIGLVVRSGGEG